MTDFTRVWCAVMSWSGASPKPWPRIVNGVEQLKTSAREAVPATPLQKEVWPGGYGGVGGGLQAKSVAASFKNMQRRRYFRRAERLEHQQRILRGDGGVISG